MDGDANWEFLELNGANELLEYIAVWTNFTEVLEAWCRADVVVFSSIGDIVSFVLGRVSAPIASAISSNYTSRGTAEVSALQIRYDRLAEQRGNVTSE